ncbi:hypothetical protein EJB05_54161, partial [Eragrostis curvula]
MANLPLPSSFFIPKKSGNRDRQPSCTGAQHIDMRDTYKEVNLAEETMAVTLNLKAEQQSNDLEPTMLLMCDAAVDQRPLPRQALRPPHPLLPRTPPPPWRRPPVAIISDPLPNPLQPRLFSIAAALRCRLERETAVFFDMSHLRYLATTARWDELTSYVHRFLPSSTSLPATLFLQRLHIYQVLGTIADIDRLYPLLDDTAAKDRPHVATLRIFFHDVRKRPPRDVASRMQVWKTAAEKLEKLALKCPDLKGKLHLPHSPHYAPKRWQINLSGVRPTRKAYKEKGNKPKALFHCLLQAGDQQETFSSAFPLRSATELIG